MTQSFRTECGGRIRRDRTLAFSFDGRGYVGYEGDTLASALLANGVHLVARSFKYHRPRGIVALAAEEPNALVTIDRSDGRITPNQRATQVALYEGLRAHSQNRWPSLTFDVGVVAQAAGPLLSAGFYYKTFMRPRALWRRLYEPAIRRAAGLGRAPGVADPDRYLHRYVHCEVLVIGSGPAGVAAALAASASGARVILCDEQAELGGSLLAETADLVAGKAVGRWRDDALATLAARGCVTLLPRTTAFGWFPDNFIGLAQRVTDHLAAPDPRLPRERLWQVRAASVVLATGAIERPLVFPHNDRPGVMLADAARSYLQRYGVKVGTRVVVATRDDSAYHAALALHAAGVTIAAIADQRPASDGTAVIAARNAGLAVVAGTAVTATSGHLRLRAVRLSGHSTAVSCDALLICGGWTPSVHLFSQSRGRLRFDPTIGAFVPGEPAANVHCAGACAGTFELAGCIAEGYAAGEAAVSGSSVAPAAASISPKAGADASASPACARTVATTVGAGPTAPTPMSSPHAKAFVDLQNDVTTKDLRIATGEGFRSIEHVKRYTTAGMATDQGKTSNINTLATVAGFLGEPIPAVGHTTFRMPYTPVSFGTLAGAARGPLLEPVRQTPLHDWAAAHGAVFEDVGTWKRARCFPHAGEAPPAAVARECHAVRNAVGLFDASTLGKIEVVGRDAAAFLDLFYPIDVASLAVGRCRYAVMLGENGFVMDDGIVARLMPDRFHVTTTTGGAATVLHHMEDYRQTEFPHLQVWLTSITEQWGVVAVQGPQARMLIASLLPDVDLAAMAHMSVLPCRIAGREARLFRVSFTGEHGYELNVPAGTLPLIWNGLLAAGATLGVTAYGTDAMHVLRAEKGYVVAGQDTDGTVTLADLGLGWMIRRTGRDFVGKRSLSLPDLCRADRCQLVGLLTADPRVVLEEGAQLVAEPRASVPAAMLGHVTSAYWSDTLQRSIALGLLAGGRRRLGETLYVPMTDRVIPVTVTEPTFYDRGGERLHV